MPKLTLAGDDGWYTIERAEHAGRQWLEPIGPNAVAFQCSERISDADVEGTREEMLAIAEAIEKRGSYSANRCAVDVDVDRDRVEFESPRNSQRPGFCSLAEADELAREIRQKLGAQAEGQSDG